MKEIVAAAGLSPQELPDELYLTMLNQINNPRMYATFEQAPQLLSTATRGKLTLAQAQKLHTAMFSETQKSWSSRRLDSALSWSRDLSRRVARRND